MRTTVRTAAVGVIGTLALTLTACSSADTEGAAPSSTKAAELTFDESGRPVLDDSFSKAVQAANGVTVDTSAFKAEPPYNVATITQGPVNGWATTFDLVMKDSLAKSGKVGDVMYVPWDGVTENQVKGMEDAIAADVDAIVLLSMSRAGLVSSIERAAAAGIPVITCMGGAETDAYTAEVNADIPLQGFQTADEISKKLDGKGQVVMLNGTAGVDSAEFWRSGANAAFSQYPEIEIVTEQYADWSAAKAMDVMRTVVAQYPDVDAVWVGGLEMGPSVIQAYKEGGAELPLVGGTNPTNGFLRLAIENDLDFYVAPFTPAAPQECVNTMLKVLDGQPVPKFTNVADVLEGAAPYGKDEASTWFEAAFNDDFNGPKVLDDKAYLDAGFGK
ncbi:substrate-binding domain-containing protein [Cellulomonas fengjieae]|uniref:Substrate-binding domain-containing protein n=1 Tax=Cellulomonas fengjieae TaxID=2819978 RepID=A0ABS3SHD2_9CELL|nr:substrate-binding domain-containing protein [Cellulomonas fengjieae]MBO3084739.1 substrate-binding domain-containing protein [Cellulomonas fengjieae]QVI66939.1 substrate-binding domain-containing protein [Cellulomonas fengjieae]